MFVGIHYYKSTSDYWANSVLRRSERQLHQVLPNPVSAKSSIYQKASYFDCWVAIIIIGDRRFADLVAIVQNDLSTNQTHVTNDFGLGECAVCPR